MRVRRTVLFILLALVGVAVWTAVSRRRAKPYPALFAWLLDNPLSARLLGTQTTLYQIGLRPGQHVLEIGPGSGRLLIPAAERVLPGGAATGLEVQSGMVQMLRQHATQAGATNVFVVQGDATASHFPPESFDTVTSCSNLAVPSPSLRDGPTHTTSRAMWCRASRRQQASVRSVSTMGGAAIRPTSCGRNIAIS